MTGGPVQAFAELEAAIDNALKVCADQLWQCREDDVVDLVRRQHRAVAKLQFLGLDTLTPKPSCSPRPVSPTPRC